MAILVMNKHFIKQDSNKRRSVYRKIILILQAEKYYLLETRFSFDIICDVQLVTQNTVLLTMIDVNVTYPALPQKNLFDGSSILSLL